MTTLGDSTLRIALRNQIPEGQLTSIAMQMLYPDLLWMWTHQHCNADALSRLTLDVDSSALQCRCSIQTYSGCGLISIAMQMLYPDLLWMWTHQHCNADLFWMWTHQHCNADALSRLTLDVDSSAMQCNQCRCSIQTYSECGLISNAMQMLYPDLLWMWTHQYCNADALSRLTLDERIASMEVRLHYLIFIKLNPSQSQP